MHIEMQRKLERQYSDKTDFKIKMVTRDNEGYYPMVKGSIKEEDITVVNIYTSNIRAPE